VSRAFLMLLTRCPNVPNTYADGGCSRPAGDMSEQWKAANACGTSQLMAWILRRAHQLKVPIVVRHAQCVLLGFSLLAITAGVARADPISVTGRAWMDDIPAERYIDFRIQIGDVQFFVAASADTPTRRFFFPAAQWGILENGGSTDLSSRFSFPLGLIGEYRFGPQDLLYGGNFMFSATPSVLRCGDPPVGGCSSRSRFSFTGTLLGAGLSGQPLFEWQLVGSGEASGFFQSDFGAEGPHDTGRLRTLSYTFDTEPVPEPGTLVLFGSGAAAMARAAWKRRKRAAGEQLLRNWSVDELAEVDKRKPRFERMT
jgi:hypothetical protein